MRWRTAEGPTGDVAAYVIAHEYAHHIQHVESGDPSGCDTVSGGI